MTRTVPYRMTPQDMLAQTFPPGTSVDQLAGALEYEVEALAHASADDRDDYVQGCRYLIERIKEAVSKA